MISSNFHKNLHLIGKKNWFSDMLLQSGGVIPMRLITSVISNNHIYLKWLLLLDFWSWPWTIFYSYWAKKLKSSLKTCSIWHDLLVYNTHKNLRIIRMINCCFCFFSLIFYSKQVYDDLFFSWFNHYLVNMDVLYGVGTNSQLFCMLISADCFSLLLVKCQRICNC